MAEMKHESGLGYRMGLSIPAADAAAPPPSVAARGVLTTSTTTRCGYSMALLTLIVPVATTGWIPSP